MQIDFNNIKTETVHAMQNDTGRTLEVDLFENGTPWDVPVGATVTFRGTNADGTHFSDTATFSDNTVTVDLTKGIKVAGKGFAELEIDDGDVVTTFDFMILTWPEA